MHVEMAFQLNLYQQQPDADDEEVVPEEPGAQRHVSIIDADKLVAKPALLIHRPAPAHVAKRQISVEFNGTDCEEVNPELAPIFREFQNEPGKLQFNAALATHARLSPLSFCQRLLTPPLVYDQSSRPCYQAWPMLF